MPLVAYKIRTQMGEVGYDSDMIEISGLTETEIAEFDVIGYSGKDSNGNKTTPEDYLNSLGKGEFLLSQTKFDNGDFIEEYIVSHHYALR